MKKPVTELIKIDTTLAVPVYKQIVQSICRNIENGTLAKDDVLPSVNKISEEFSLARGSVFTAYNDLRASGIIDSIPGKGYFVSSTETKQDKRIFLLLDSFTPYNGQLFNALLNNLPKTIALDVYFHHHNIRTFELLIREQVGYYNTFIIMPAVHDETLNILSKLDPKRIFLLDAGYKEYRKEFPGVFQNFEKDIYSVLTAYQNLSAKYKRLLLTCPDAAHTKDIVSGFNKFAKKTGISAAVKGSIEPTEVKKGDAFIVLDDDDLVQLVTLSKTKGWQLGKDIGVLSYNETTLKSVIGDGISTVTADFETMAKTIADMVTTGRHDVVENPFRVIDRKSF